ncbi:VanZ family protein [Bacillus sp. RAR_GA_16]|uniref:VanZ family protein n=1 Tax=Bacillus sp. RAR_GA_16 TaxID=2876774 RepID=UPI001CCF280F|nr:VanZ family protein [Bacillus sp. RAR_GA_16]MCA0172819.1 VanZ family protein [Bacillus sp. RAR_GA_16]
MKFITKRKWAFLALTMMTILFISSHTPYQKQDVKPLFKGIIVIEEDDLPQIAFTYDGVRVTPSAPYQYVEFFIRKGAHVASFALLAFLCTMAAREFKRQKTIFLGSIIAFLYALFDEFHQSLVEGRTGHLIDVFVPDTLGIVLTFLLFLIFSRTEHAKEPRH